VFKDAFPVPPPPLSEDYYPCAENCHSDMDVDPTPRTLEDEHDDVELHHAEQFRWCLDCHDAEDRDKLRLQSGEKIGFDESYRLCGQCHGARFRDWKLGIHGKRTGSWNGKTQYLLCAHCHDPHNPAWKPIKPERPPAVPGSGTLSSHQPSAHGPAESHGEKKDH
jgi:hypothetical protein